jgi:hypothetical protein
MWGGGLESSFVITAVPLLCFLSRLFASSLLFFEGGKNKVKAILSW